MGNDFSFDIKQVAALLGMKIRRPCSDGFYTDCPFCKDKRGKLKITFGKNLFRCNYCQEGGGMLKLYGLIHGVGNSEALERLNETFRTGNYNQVQNDYIEEKKREKQPLSILQSELASIDIINHTLISLLGLLQLSKTHRQNLYERGLTDEEIDRLGYKSTPSPSLCLALTEQLIKQGCTVQGVPGFYVNKYGKWTAKFYKRTAGLIIPIRGIDRLVRGLQIRLDVPIKDKNDDPDKEGTKYIWLSSSNQHLGVTSGSPVHFAGNSLARTVYVTEGALKGDVAHFLMNRTFICIAGANNVSQLEPIFAWLAQHGTKLVIEAHDMDKYANEMVIKGASAIYSMARDYGMESKRLTWNPNYKGVDNWQLALKKKEEKVKGVYKENFKERFISGLCGIDEIDNCIEEWHNSPENGQDLHDYLGLTDDDYGNLLKNGSYEELEKVLLSQQNRQRFRIYQLDFSEGQVIKFAFRGIKAMYKAGYEQPPASEYRMIYDGDILCSISLSDKEILKLIFDKYNDNVPKDYSGRYVAPSDVVELYDDDKRQYYFRDSDSFVPVNFSPILAKPMNL